MSKRRKKVDKEKEIVLEERMRIDPFIKTQELFSLERRLNYIIGLPTYGTEQYDMIFDAVTPEFTNILTGYEGMVDDSFDIDDNWIYVSLPWLHILSPEGKYTMQPGKIIFAAYQKQVLLHYDFPDLIYAPLGAYIQDQSGVVWYAPESYFINKQTWALEELGDLLTPLVDEELLFSFWYNIAWEVDEKIHNDGHTFPDVMEYTKTLAKQPNLPWRKRMTATNGSYIPLKSIEDGQIEYYKVPPGDFYHDISRMHGCWGYETQRITNVQYEIPVFFLPNCYFRKWGGPWVSLDKGYLVLHMAIEPPYKRLPDSFRSCANGAAYDILTSKMFFFEPLRKDDEVVKAFLAAHPRAVCNAITCLRSLGALKDKETPHEYWKMFQLLADPFLDESLHKLEKIIDETLAVCDPHFGLSYYVIRKCFEDKLEKLDYRNLTFPIKKKTTTGEMQIDTVSQVLRMEPRLLEYCAMIVKNYKNVPVKEVRGPVQLPTAAQFEEAQASLSKNPISKEIFETLDNVGLVNLIESGIKIERDRVISDVHRYISECKWKQNSLPKKNLTASMKAVYLLSGEPKLIQLWVRHKCLKYTPDIPYVLQTYSEQTKFQNDMIPELLWIIEDKDFDLVSIVDKSESVSVQERTSLSSYDSMKAEEREKLAIELEKRVFKGMFPEQITGQTTEPLQDIGTGAFKTEKVHAASNKKSKTLKDPKVKAQVDTTSTQDPKRKTTKQPVVKTQVDTTSTQKRKTTKQPVVKTQVDTTSTQKRKTTKQPVVKAHVDTTSTQKKTTTEVPEVYALNDSTSSLKEEIILIEVNEYIENCDWARMAFPLDKMKPELREKMFAASLLGAEPILVQLAVNYKRLKGSRVPKSLENYFDQTQFNRKMIPDLIRLVGDNDLKLESKILDQVVCPWDLQ